MVNHLIGIIFCKTPNIMPLPQESSTSPRRPVYIITNLLLLIGLAAFKIDLADVRSAFRFYGDNISTSLLRGGPQATNIHEYINVAKGKSATQSSTFKSFKANLAVDGDVTTFSRTRDSATWIEIDLGDEYHVHSVIVLNRWCEVVKDSPACLCRLSGAKLSLMVEDGNVISMRYIGDTCGVAQVVEEFDDECVFESTPTTSHACLPSAPKVKIQATTGEQIQVFEIQVFSPGKVEDPFTSSKLNAISSQNSTMQSESTLELKPSFEIHTLSNNTGYDNNNQQKNHTTLALVNSSATPTKSIYYSLMRGDRSGSAMMDMIYCHAYCYQKNFTYGGAITDQTKRLAPVNQKLFKKIGLNLPIIPTLPSNDINTRHIILRPGQYRELGLNGKFFTPDYLKYLRSQTIYAETDIEIAVHIRRGDVSPCNWKEGVAWRYLPNSYYLDLIKQHAKPDSKVVIYSQSYSFESLDIFKDLGYELIINGSMGDVWEEIVNANIVIMSKSAFSYLPAMFNRGKVLYPGAFARGSTDFVLPGWEYVNVSVYHQEKALMQKESCNETSPFANRPNY